jgi:hypothetical protein
MKKWIFCFVLILAGSKIWAQGCSLCSLNAQSIGKEAGIGLNHGIIYLAAIPLIFVSVVGVIWFRRNRPDQEE